MKVLFRTDSHTTAGLHAGGVSALVTNSGAGSATVAGKTLAPGDSITFNTVHPSDHVEFKFDATGTTIDITFGTVGPE